jgi:hypothetical protein
VVGDDAIAAGGSVSLSPAAKVGGRAWLSGGRIDISGTVAGELAATGGRIVLSGQIGGDVDLTAESIRILESAIIDGDLVYRSPRQADIAAGAQIRGTTRYDPVERPMMPIIAAAAGMSVLAALSLGITGGAMFLLFPRFIGEAVKTIGGEPWKTLGLGLAVFAATPVVIGLLLMTVIGWLPAVIVGALYLLLLLGGFLTGAFYVGDVIFGLARRERVSPARRIGSLVAALVLVMLLALVPLLGELVLLALLLLGVGALNLGMYRAYVDQ